MNLKSSINVFMLNLGDISMVWHDNTFFNDICNSSTYMYQGIDSVTLKW